MKIIIFWGLLLFPYWAWSQPQRTLSPEELDNLLQSLFAVQDDDLNYADLYESFYQLYTNPIDLRRAQPEDLKALYVLNDQQIHHFFQHQAQYGQLLSLYELQAIEGWDLETIRKILPFVRLSETDFAQDNRSLWERIRAEKNNFLLIRHERTLEPRQGYQNGNYLGSPDQWYVRFRVSHAKDFSIGLTGETDAGEKMMWNPKTQHYGFDFWSFHVAVYNRQKLKALLVGDYQIQVGQGLLLSGGFGIGKGAETILTTRRQSLGILPYTSVVEGNFFRGLAATYQLTPTQQITTFVSHNPQDAAQRTDNDTITDLDSENNAYINSIRQTGLHRTATELQARYTTTNTTYGLHWVWKKRNQELGFTALQTYLSNPIRPIPKNYNQFEFRGSMNWNIGVHYSWVWQNLNFFGETAVSKSGAWGTVNGLIANLSDKWQMAWVYRNYARHFHSFYGNAFSENTRNINEQGIYWGVKFQPSRQWTWTAYFDQFRFGWLRFLVDAPSEGFEVLTRLSYAPSKTVQLYLQYRNETKGRNLANNSLARLDLVVPSQKQNWQIDISTRIPNVLHFRTRLQASDYQQDGRTKTYGYALVQDVSAEYKQLQASLRFALFDTDDYDNRQYIFEKDVQYAFSIPAYYGRGFRQYYLIEYHFSKHLSLWFRYTYTLFRDRTQIGTGNETINGQNMSEIKTQLRWRW